MLIGSLSYLAGVRLTRPISVMDVWEAVAIGLLSTNFIYTVNAIADRHIDAVNAPTRTLPAGRMPLSVAKRYAWVLGIAASLYPLALITRSVAASALLFLLPVWGIAYSLRPFRLKRYPAAAVAVTSVGLLTPVTAGYLLNTSSHVLNGPFVPLLCLCLCVVPLKDITDAPGDTAYGIGNLYARYGTRLIWFSAIGSLATLALAVAMPMSPSSKRIAIVLPISVLTAILVSHRNASRIYRRVICAALVGIAALLIIL